MYKEISFMKEDTSVKCILNSISTYIHTCIALHNKKLLYDTDISVLLGIFGTYVSEAGG